MLLASRCPLCRRVGSAPCGPCVDGLEPAGAVVPPAGVDVACALLRYEGAGRELIARIKYRNARASLPWLGRGMAGLVTTEIDTVTWVPTTAARRHQRGFDQARLLARVVARHLDLPCRSLLTRPPGAPQTGRTRRERLAGPQFVARAGAVGTTGRRVLLVDDVLTTGATATAAAVALRQHGAAAVVLVVAARTPPRRPATG